MLVSKDWGCEVIFVNNDLYCGKLLLVYKDKWTSGGRYHYHKIKDETFYILEGVLRLVVEDQEMVLQEGDSLRIKPNTRHKFTAGTSYCKFVEVSTHHEDSDSYRE